jgi:glycosyltransferase involved in cell wall biosynthesis
MITGRADIGGGPEHVFQLARIIARSTTVHIACPREEPYWSRYESLVGTERMVEIPHRRLTPGALVRLVRFIRTRKIDVVHAHGRAAGIFARPAALLANVRCFYTPHGGTPINSARTLFYAAVEYLLSTITRGIVAVSGTEAQTLRTLCALPDRLAVIQNGVEIPASIEAPDTRLAGPLRIVHVTRFVFQKNSELLLDVISSLRDLGKLGLFEFVLLGDGPGRAAFEADVAARGLGDFVKIVGAVSNPGVYLSSAFCFISTSRWEGLPLALLEAMARGVPAIATDVVGNKDAVTDHETGFLYDLAAPQVAAQRLVQLAHYPVLWKQMVHAARQRAEEEFSVQAMADATLQLYTRPDRSGKPAHAPRTGVLRPPALFPVPGVGRPIHNARQA